MRINKYRINLLNFIYCKAISVVRLFCRTVQIPLVKRFRYGIKTTYYMTNQQTDMLGTVVVIDKDNLFLEPDYLMDEYTLINQPISNSPHYFLMRAIEYGEDIMTTDYIRRYERGQLDIRFPCYVSKKLIDRMKNAYLLNKDKIQLGTSEPVLVYKKLERYYIYDGKHRAALAAFLGKDIQCVVLRDSMISRKLLNKILILMSKNSDRYRKTLEFYKDFEHE